MSAVQISDIRWLDPARNLDERCNLRLEGDQLQACAELDERLTTLDGTGLWLMPGMIDLQHHLAAPGPVQPSDISGELHAAWHRGIATVVAKPDTQPVIDNASVIEWIERRAQEPSARPGHAAELLLTGALTAELGGTQLSDMAALREAGCVALSQGAAPLPPVDLLRQCLRYAADLKIPVHLSAQTPGLHQGSAHDGALANALGLTTIPVASETVAVATILALVEDTGCQVHIAQLSSAAAAQLYADGRRKGLPISADVAIWNLLYDESAIAGYNSQFHLLPPLRSSADRAALLSLVMSGDIPAICSGHRPHSPDAKFGPFADTLPGASSLDGYLALLLQLADAQGLSPLSLAQRTSLGPATAFARPVPTPERATSWLLVDPEHTWRLTQDTMQSAARNTPLWDHTLTGSAAGWLRNGKIELFGHWQARLGV